MTSAAAALPGEANRQAVLRLAAFGIAWAVLETGVGSQLRGDYHLLQVVWCRYAVHLATLGLLFFWRRPDRLWRTSRPVYQLTRSLMMLVMPASFVLTLDLGVAPDTTWSVFWLSPVLIIVLARLLLHERATWQMWATSVLGAIAVVVMLDSPPVSLAGLVVPVVMALSFSVYVVMTRSLATETVFANLFYTAFGVFVVLTLFMPVVWVMPSWHDAVVLAEIGVLGLVALLALDRACALGPVSSNASVLYVQVVAVPMIGVLFGHQMTRRMMAGAAVVAAIVAVHWLQESSSVTRGGHEAAFVKDPAQ